MSSSSTTTEKDLIGPIHLGEVLMEDFIEGFGITQNKLAVSIGLARYSRTSEGFWMNLQSNYELRIERRKLRSMDVIEPLVTT